MSGIKIINVLKDDTFPEILELFRQASAGEVIFVLPKKSAVFRREDHFAAFASEAAGSGKAISIMCSNPDVNALAKKYKFTVMSSAKAGKEATLASNPPPGDDDTPDFDDAVPQDEDDVVVPSDQRPMNYADESEEDSEEIAPGMHVEDENGPVDDDDDGRVDTPEGNDMTVGADFIAASAGPVQAEVAAIRVKGTVDGVKLSPPRKSVSVSGKAEKAAAVPVEHSVADLDYIDAVWREKAAQTVGPQDRPAIPRKSTGRSRPWQKLSFSSVGLSKKAAAGILGASVIVLGAIVFMVYGSAHVVLKPIAKSVDTQIAAQASDVFSSVDAGFGKVPGQIYAISKTGTANGIATGQRDVASKARGKVTIYNEFSSSPQPLVATTRFASSGGLIFRTLQSVTVPGSSVKDGKVVAGSVTVDVIADKPGAQYNIEPGRFTIPAFQEKGDTERLAKIYAISTSAFSGGANGPSKVVTQSDYDTAKASAVKAAKDQIMDAFRQQSSGLMILEGVEPVISGVTSTANPDDAAENFTVSATATLNTVAFRQADLYKLIKDTVLTKNRLEVFPDKLALTYNDIAYKDDVGVLSFTIGIKGSGFAPVDIQAIASDIRGMDAQGFRDYFKAKDGIESATLNLSPVWVQSIPDDTSKIDIQVDHGK